jgi:hypothetical protein
MQEYMHRVVKLIARAPGVSESSTIDAIVGGLRVGNCQDVLDRIKPKSLQELFEVMQEYCKSERPSPKAGPSQRSEEAKAIGAVGPTEGVAESPVEAGKPSGQQCICAPRPEPESEWQWAQRWTQKWQRAEAAAAKPTTAGGGGQRKVFLLAPWDRRSPPHPSMPFGDQEEVGVGS